MAVRTVLVIDDDEEMCESLRRSFDGRLKVICAFSGRDGLELLARETLSIVLLDYKLNDADGIDILSAIRRKSKVPVIMITGFGDKDTVLSSWQHGADYFFDKPFNNEELYRKITELIRVETPSYLTRFDRNRLPPVVNEALESIAFQISNCTDVREINLKNISSLVSLSPSHLSVLLKKECGMSFREIVAALKTEQAERFIRDGYSVKEISILLGFDHPNNFSRLFRRVTGRAPSDLKK